MSNKPTFLTTKRITGAGGGKGGGSTGRVAVESPDSLRSKQYAKILDLVSEGPIYGLVNGMKSIYLNAVPLQNADNTFNFNDVTVASVLGTQNQDYIPGFEEAGSEQAVGIKVVTANPIVRTILSRSISGADAVRITLGVPQLTLQNQSNGDINGTAVTVAIDVQHNGGGYVEKLQTTFDGKTTTRYQRSIRITFPQSETGPWDIRIRRITADSTQVYLQNDVWWDSYTVITDAKFRYPNSAIIGAAIDAAQFSSIPTRGYHLKGLLVKYPSNYNPTTRTYTGTWNGTFTTGWTDNPAWCFYDLVTNDRYGLGQFVEEALVDKWALYDIARYCDAVNDSGTYVGVDDGYGGLEPRFTCNLFLQSREEAYTVLQNMASIFRGIIFWSSGQVSVSQDKPEDPTIIFTQANVIDGRFIYSGSSAKTRHTVALVGWNDINDLSVRKIEYVEDREGIAELGVNEIEFVAFGCSSRGQAHRAGKWLLYTERYETETITFKTGLDASDIVPGRLFYVSDANRIGTRFGGRIISATGTTIVLDNVVTLLSGTTYTLSCVLPDGTVETRTVITSSGTTETLTISSAFSADPLDLSVWMLQPDTIDQSIWRCLTITEEDDHTFSVVGLAHNPEKFALIESGVQFTDLPSSLLTTVPAVPSNFSASVYVQPVANGASTLQLIIGWDAAQGATRYEVTWKAAGGNYVTEVVYTNSFTVNSASLTEYTFIVKSVNSIGVYSGGVTYTYTVTSASFLPDVTGLALVSAFLGPDISIKWDAVTSANQYKIEIGEGTTITTIRRTVYVTDTQYTYTHQQNAADGGPFRTLAFRVYAIYNEQQSANPATLTATNSPPAAPSVSVTPAAGAITIQAIKSAALDFAGMLVYGSTTSGFTPGSGSLIYDGPNTSYLHAGLIAGVPWYYKIAFYDTFGTDGAINYTSEISATPYSDAEGVPVVASLPVSGMTEGDVVYLTTDDKLYRYNGSTWVTWVDGSDLLTSSVTAGKIAVSQLSAIAADLGTVTAGSYTLAPSATSYIAGGQTSYDIGNGFWMGYVGGLFKASFGNYLGNKLTWDGSTLSITGNITLTSGSSTAAVEAGSGINLIPAAYSLFNAGALPPVQEANGANGNFSLDLSVGYFTNQSLKLTATATNYGIYLSSGETVYNIPITPNKKWIVSAYVRGSIASMPGQLYVRYNDGGLDTITLVTDFNTDATPGVWSRVSGVIDLSAKSDTTCLVRIDNDNGSGDMWIDGVMLEEQIGALTAPSTYDRGGDNVGSRLADGLTIISGGITMSGGGSIKGGQTDYNTGTGWFLGYSGGAYKFSVGNPSGHHMRWDGSTLTVSGTLTTDYANITGTKPPATADNTNTAISAGTTISGGGIVFSSGGSIASSGKSYGNATAGVFLGYSGGAYKFDIGTSSQYIRWDGSTLTVGGTIIATGNIASDSVSKINSSYAESSTSFANGDTIISASSHASTSGNPTVVIDFCVMPAANTTQTLRLYRDSTVIATFSFTSLYPGGPFAFTVSDAPGNTVAHTYALKQESGGSRSFTNRSIVVATHKR